MSEETMEPRTFEDLWLMCETSKEWFDGQVRYENTRNGADPEVGMVDSVSWCVVPSASCVRVVKKTHVICDVNSSHSFSCRIEREAVAKYGSMDEFRDSEWWDLTMDKFAGGDTDASWLDSVEIDGVEVPTYDPQWIGYRPTASICMEVGKKYTDWLDNNRQAKGHDELSIRVERMSGEIYMSRGEHTVEGTVEDLEKAVMLMERLRDLGVEVCDETITVPLPKME